MAVFNQKDHWNQTYIPEIHPPPLRKLREDPGRSSLRAEWAVPGDLVFEHGSTNDGGSNGLVRVTGSGASSGGSWRRLRFNETTEQSCLGTTGPKGRICRYISTHPKWEKDNFIDSNNWLIKKGILVYISLFLRRVYPYDDMNVILNICNCGPMGGMVLFWWQ